MNGTGIINYQGSKLRLINFIKNNIVDYINEGDCVLDLFAGSGAVSNSLKDKYIVYANDMEPYSYVINSAILNRHSITGTDLKLIQKAAETHINTLKDMSNGDIIGYENELLKKGDIKTLCKLYDSYPTVWNNSGITPENLRKENKYNLFTNYYAGSYFGIYQSMEIDSILYAISLVDNEVNKNVLLSCLFYALKESVFSKDGHMAQPLDISKYPKRAIIQRTKSIELLFMNKLNDVIGEYDVIYSFDNRVYNNDFINLIKKESLNNVKLIYADPPYTDMQYSRYYHILNVAVNYDYPELTIHNGRYTKGLYTEGRNQSKLSQKSKAKDQLKSLMQFCNLNKIALALSFAYPKDITNQATDRYTVSIEELKDMATDIFGKRRVVIKSTLFSHSNNRNSKNKQVYEYLILCGDKIDRKPPVSIQKLKEELRKEQVQRNNPMYRSNLYWSKKSFNINNIMIQHLSKQGDVVFDPFMGSGTTILEAINKNTMRKGIGVDVNEVPIFIVNTLLSIVGLENIEVLIDDFVEKINKFQTYYETKCPCCGKKAITNNVVFDKPNRKDKNITIREINYICESCNERGNKKPDKIDYEMLNISWTLQNINDIKLIRNSKIAVGDNDKISDIFTPRNFCVLDNIVGIIDTYENKEQNILKYILMSVLHLCKITDTHSNSQWPLWIPSIKCVEKNIIFVLERKCKGFINAWRYVNKNYIKDSLVYDFNSLSEGNCLLFLKGSQHISNEDIPDRSVDLIITDPPYLEQVMYSEYMQLYKPFLGFDFNLEDEIVVSSAPSRDKKTDEYFALLDSVFDMCSKKIKINSYMCLYFHDSDLTVWTRLIEILYKNGFEFISQTHIPKTNTLKNIISPKRSLKGDSILFFQYLGTNREYRDGRESITEIEVNIIRQAKAMIVEKGELSTTRLYDDGLMEVIIHNGWLRLLSQKYTDLIDLFEKHLRWNKSTGKWGV